MSEKVFYWSLETFEKPGYSTKHGKNNPSKVDVSNFRHSDNNLQCPILTGVLKVCGYVLLVLWTLMCSEVEKEIIQGLPPVSEAVKKERCLCVLWDPQLPLTLMPLLNFIHSCLWLWNILIREQSSNKGLGRNQLERQGRGLWDACQLPWAEGGKGPSWGSPESGGRADDMRFCIYTVIPSPGHVSLFCAKRKLF